MLKLVIFDVDGTLIDSQALILAAMAHAFEGAGLAPPGRGETLGIVGLSLPEAMATLLPEGDTALHMRLVELYKQGYGEIRARGAEAESPFYPGALETVAALDESGYLLGVATGKARRGLDRMLDAHDLRTRFVVTQTADDAPSKPHPGMVLNCLERTGVEPESALVIGDTEYDMAMARAAGARALGVGWGYHDGARLARGGAERVLGDFAGVESAVAEMLGAP